ncbi:MAG: hypothetical protein HYR96_10560 [Deltaproteobacteria bacterium]|nr:hypothetical protein [Deltaproteobacteria bacterium]
MKIHLWGTDFRRSHADFRRSLYIDPQVRAERLKELMTVGFTDLVYLNTCNRIEFYTSARDYFSDTRPLWVEMLRRFGLAEDAFYSGYQLEGKSALRHLLRVASSLESLVIGEPQILGQIKDGLRWTVQQGMPISNSLSRSFQIAFETAKAIRANTAIGSESVSVASLGMEQVELMEVDFPLTTVAVVGRSPMSIIVVNWLKKNRPHVPFRWVNRNPELLAQEEAAQGVEIESLERFIERPGTFSHLFTASGSPIPLFDEAFFGRVDAVSPLAFDFAEPPDVAQLPEACRTRVVRLDDLKTVAHRNREHRRGAVVKAETIIDLAIRDYFQEQKEAPVLRDFSVLEPILLGEIDRLMNEVNPAGCSRDELRQWAEKLVKRNLHTSRMQLKSILKTVADSEQVQAVQWDL